MKIIQKLFFPFWNKEKHDFLLKKVWFRLLMVLFIGWVILVIPTIWINNVNRFYDDCMNNWYKSYGINDYLDEANKRQKIFEIKINCNNATYKAWTYPWILWDAIIFPLFIFYIGQLLFFIIGVNFIYLGSRK